MTEPVVGWRLWRLRAGHLLSWAVDYCWEPGENHARCIAHGRSACMASPGQYCQCGIWAVWSPRDCRERARTAAADRSEHVLGLIVGWGTVAVHGREGFRAEWAAIRCLFTNRPATLAARTIGSNLFGWWPRGSGQAPADPLGEPGIDPPRWDALHSVAARYGVPLVSLRKAVGMGLLGEMGIPRKHIAEAGRLTGLAVEDESIG